jgi:ABC-2 type transport system permease protein
MKVINQSIFPPIVSSLIYIVIFSFIIGKNTTIQGVNYLEFILPGLVMMAIINNSFGNSAYSVFISKFTKHLEHVLTMPLSYFELSLAYVLGSIARGLLTGIGIIIVLAFFINITIHNIFFVIIYFLMAAILFGSLGILTALWSKTFDHLGVFNTFILTPLTMLGGVFYSIKVLPETFQKLTLFNPIFYLVDGFRYGMLGIHDGSILIGLIVSLILSICSFFLIVYLMKKGWKVKQ